MPNPIKIVKGVAKVTRGKQKAAKKPGRVINAEGKLATKRGKGMVSEAPLVKGKNSKANVTDWKSIQKALSSDNKKSRYITKKKKG